MIEIECPFTVYFGTFPFADYILPSPVPVPAANAGVSATQRGRVKDMNKKATDLYAAKVDAIPKNANRAIGILTLLLSPDMKQKMLQHLSLFGIKKPSIERFAEAVKWLQVKYVPSTSAEVSELNDQHNAANLVMHSSSILWRTFPLSSHLFPILLLALLMN